MVFCVSILHFAVSFSASVWLGDISTRFHLAFSYIAMEILCLAVFVQGALAFLSFYLHFIQNAKRLHSLTSLVYTCRSYIDIVFSVQASWGIKSHFQPGVRSVMEGPARLTLEPHT